MVLYDLPITNRQDVGAANRFNHLLADLGLVRIQYSVYARYTPTQSGCRSANQDSKRPTSEDTGPTLNQRGGIGTTRQFWPSP